MDAVISCLFRDRDVLPRPVAVEVELSVENEEYFKSVDLAYFTCSVQCSAAVDSSSTVLEPSGFSDVDALVSAF